MVLSLVGLLVVLFVPVMAHGLAHELGLDREPRRPLEEGAN